MDKKQDNLYTLSKRDLPQTEGHIQTESEGMVKDKRPTSNRGTHTD